MSEFKFPLLEITVAYNDASDISELLKAYHPNIISVFNSSDSVFDIVGPEASLDIPEIAKFVIEHENPEQTEAEIIALADEHNYAIGTRIVKNEDELTQGEIIL
jgi:hypothetical protein